jgi:starch synthase
VKILLASSEVYPYSKTGGLADMVGSLARTLARHGHRVGMVTPLYAGIRERYPDIRPANMPLDFPLGASRAQGEVWELEPERNLTVYFVDQPNFYQRTGLYQQFGADYPDNSQRFIFFSKAVAHLALLLPWKPELVHLHDWQAAFAALLLHHQRSLPGWETSPPTCLTIHNLAYQGSFGPEHYSLANLPWDYFNPAGCEFYGQVNFLKAGIAFSKRLTTVSPRYAREITTDEFGCGLQGLLREKGSRLKGILNGVDYTIWNTTSNKFLHHPFNLENPSAKLANKTELQREYGLPEDKAAPLFASIGRLVQQKGVDLMLAALEVALASSNMQFVLLGSGDPVFQSAFLDLAARYPTRASVRIGFDEGLSHRIEAGADFFLMPSRFEPCGLNQMYSLRFGAIPIVRATGGLDDSVVDIRESADTANGIKFSDISWEALEKAIRKALVVFSDADLLKHYRRNSMKADFSWEKTSRSYEVVYREVIEKG